jgi:hypothetical protein
MNVQTLAYRTVVGLCVIAFGVIGASTAAHFVRAAPVSIEVYVTDHLGQPVADLVVTAFGNDQEDVVSGLTDATGAVTLTIERPNSHASLVVALIPPMLDQMSQYEYREQEVRRREVLGASSYAHRHVVPLQEGVSQYQLSIQGTASVNVSGRACADGNGAPTMIAEFGDLLAVRAERDTGEFELGGVALAESTLISLVRGLGQIEIVELTEVDTAQDVQLGDIDLLPLPADARLDLDVINYGQLDLRGRSAARAVSLVVGDGSWAVSLMLDETGRARVTAWPGADDLSIPAGTYYICPGPIGPDPVTTRLVQLAREGVVDLDAAGVIKVTAIAGQVTSLQVDAPSAEAAVVNAGG